MQAYLRRTLSFVLNLFNSIQFSEHLLNVSTLPGTVLDAGGIKIVYLGKH